MCTVGTLKYWNWIELYFRIQYHVPSFAKVFWLYCFCHSGMIILSWLLLTKTALGSNHACDLPFIKNGQCESKGNYVHVKCGAGYQLTGSSQILCQPREFGLLLDIYIKHRWQFEYFQWNPLILLYFASSFGANFTILQDYWSFCSTICKLVVPGLVGGETETLE